MASIRACAALAVIQVLAGCGALGVTSAGVYRIPYEDGVEVTVLYDFEHHNPPGRYDFVGPKAVNRIVAAADGWVRFINDSNFRYELHETQNNFVWIEHPYPFCQPGVDWPGKPHDYDQTCVPCPHQNQSGVGSCSEWTKYSHLQTHSVRRNAGLTEGDWVTAGTFLGYEGDVGYADGVHLHWEVARLDPERPLSNVENGWAKAPSEAGPDWPYAPNLIPKVCDFKELEHGKRYVARPCSARGTRKR